MKSGHIIGILDSDRASELSLEEVGAMESHCHDCEPCRSALQAHRVSSLLLESTRESVRDLSPSPDFRASVMRAVRAKAASEGPVGSILRWWQASMPIMSAMVIVVLVLGALAAFAPESEQDPAAANHSNLYPTETVLIDSRSSSDLNKEQVFQVIYTTRFEGKK